MRTLTLLTAATFALAALPAAQAQDACTQSSPCPWDVVVDQPGFIGESSWNWTQGDWMTLSVANDDTVAHTVTLDGYGLTFSLAAGQEQSKVVQLAKSGGFQMKDQPSGDAVTVTVVNGDVVDYEKGLIDSSGNALTTGAKGRIPGLELPLLAAGLLAAVAGARRSP